MPLKCVTTSGETVFAFKYTKPAWQKLSEDNRRGKHLLMPCCGRSVIVKTSHLGTQFFAHYAKARTVCAQGESEEHLLAKDLVARAVVTAGWEAQTEAILDGGRLKADVLAIKGGVRIAFEIQLSRQAEADTVRRHELYQAAGARALWLFRQADYPLKHDVPAFRLVRRAGEQGFDVWVWNERKDWRRRERTTSQSVELQTFIHGALTGKLNWRAAEGLTVPVVARIAKGECIEGHDTNSLLDFTLDVARVLPGHCNLRLSMDEIGYACPELLRSEKALELLKTYKLRVHFGVSNYSRQKWNPDYVRHASPCCVVCGDLIGTKLDGTEESVTPDFELALTLSPDVLRDFMHLDARLDQWWFGVVPGNADLRRQQRRLREGRREIRGTAFREPRAGGRTKATDGPAHIDVPDRQKDLFA